MPAFTDSLRGYSYRVHLRDGFKCVYCGLDGKESFPAWLSLTRDHLLPKGNPLRDDERYIVTACQACNCADNRYFDLAAQRGIELDGKTPEQLIEQRRTYVMKTRREYEEFWTENVVNHQG